MNSLDDDVLAMLRHVVQKELGCGPELFDLKDPVDLFAEFVAGCVTGKADDRAELLPDLVADLGDLKIASNGGRRPRHRL